MICRKRIPPMDPVFYPDRPERVIWDSRWGLFCFFGVKGGYIIVKGGISVFPRRWPPDRPPAPDLCSISDRRPAAGPEDARPVDKPFCRWINQRNYEINYTFLKCYPSDRLKACRMNPRARIAAPPAGKPGIIGYRLHKE